MEGATRMAKAKTSNPTAGSVNRTPPPYLIASDRGQERSASAVLERNLRALTRTSPRAAELVQSATARTDVEFLETGEGVLAAQVREPDEVVGDGTIVRGHVRALCSRRSPMGEAGQIAGTIDIKQVAAVAMAGFGVGHLAGVIAARMKRSGVIVIYEPDVALLRAVFERIDHSAWLRESNVVILTSAEDAAAMSAALTGVEGIVMMGLSLVEHPACGQRLQSSKGTFYAKFQGVVQAVRTMVATTLVQVDTTVRNLVTNIGYYTNTPSIADLAGIASGRHGFVVSAGPSLERNIEELARPGVREKSVIIAAQTVLKLLLARGIKPHFVTALDHSDISARFYEGLSAADVEGVTLIIEAKASPAIPRAFPGVVRCVQDRFLDTLLGAELKRVMGQLPAGATVAHLAYYLARYMGCDPVVLVGQDLGFTDGQYYSSNAAIHEVWASELNEFCTLEMMEWSRVKRMGKHLRQAPDIHGGTIYTDEQMATYLVQFERDFAKDASQGKNVIDATEGGVRKAHTTNERLRAVVDRVLADGQPHGISLGGRGSVGSCPEEPVLARLDEIRSEINRVGRVCGDTSVVLSEMLEHHADQERVNRLIAKVDTLRNEIEAIDPAYKLVHFLNQTGAFQRVRSDRAIHLDTDLTPMQRQHRAIERDAQNVEGLRACAVRLETMIRGATKLFEKESSPSIPMWEEDAEPGADACSLGFNTSNCFSTIDEIDDEPEAQPAPDTTGESDDDGVVRVVGGAPGVWAVLPLNLSEGVTGMKYRPALESVGAELVIQRTLTRLSCIKNLRGIVLLTNRVDEAQRLADGEHRRKPITIQSVDHFRTSAVRDRVRASRAWSRSCWRGGLGGATCYDEVFHPHATLEALRQVKGSAALIAGPDWCFVDPKLCDQVIERYLEDPVSRRLTFSLAPPGLAGCVVERSLIGSMAGAAEDGRWIAPIGRVLSYMPGSPTLDPTGTGVCVNVTPRVRDCGMRFIADTEVTRGRLERMWQGLAGMFMEPMCEYIAEAVRIDAERSPDTLPEEVVAHHRSDVDSAWLNWVIESLAAGGMGRALTIRSDGIDGRRLTELVQHAKERRVNVHVRVPARTLLNDLRSIIVANPEVLSLDFIEEGGVRASPEEVSERWASARSLVKTLLGESIEGSQIDQGAPATWIVPRIVRTDGTVAAIEPFFDEWIGLAGAAIIDATEPSDAVAGARIGAMPIPASYRRRLGRSRLCIIANGDSVLDPTGSTTMRLLGNLGVLSLEECWASASKARRAEGWFA